MVSRRNFIAANVMALARTALKAPSALAAASDEPEVTATIPRSQRDFWKDWPGFITTQVNRAGERRKALLARIQSHNDVAERATVVRSQLWEILGGRPAESPLRGRTVGTIARESYRIEKLIYESLPEVYVTAHLYVPTAGNGPFPAVLAPLGHTSDGKNYRNYQYCYQNLARKGYVVLAYDPFGQGERSQYLVPGTSEPRFGPTADHNQAGRPMLLLGTGLARYRVWDGIRSLDYLLSRPEVDPHRIGCTGHSGGATVTMYLMALEPRIQAAVAVEGNYENVAGPFFDPPGAIADAEQNIAGSLSRGLDRGDLLNAFAPKPFLLCYTVHDEGQTYSPVYQEAIAENYAELARIYGILGAKDHVSIRAGHLPHELDFYSRRAVYQWFNRWLGNPDAGVAEAPFDFSPNAELNCTATGQVLNSLGGRSLVQVNRDRAKEVTPPGILIRNGGDPSAARSQIRSELTTLLALPAERSALRAVTLSSEEGAGLHTEEFQIESEPGVRVVGWLVRSAKQTGRSPTVLSVSDNGVNEIVAEPSPWRAVLDQGHTVCSINLRGRGVSAPRMPHGGPAFYRGMPLEDRFAWTNLVLGKPTIGQRVWDVLRALEYLGTRPDVNASQIRIAGSGSAAIAGGMAALLEDRVRSLLIRHAIPSYQSIVDAEDYSVSLDWFVPGILEHFDLPDLLASMHPRPVWIDDAIDANGKPIPESAVRDCYRQRLPENSPVFDTLQFGVAPSGEDLYSRWLRNT
ncbi:MAG TPA: acetylxylan esterase [Acidobacteriaceae bacterium]|nr:acetylxylan esterase [Acidobacteriaceae bacterium]